MKFIIHWDRLFINGLYQFVGYKADETRIETLIDVSDGYKCRETWLHIQEKFPEADNYKAFCKAYKEAKREWDFYSEREEKRYRRFWNKY